MGAGRCVYVDHKLVLCSQLPLTYMSHFPFINFVFVCGGGGCVHTGMFLEEMKASTMEIECLHDMHELQSSIFINLVW